MHVQHGLHDLREPPTSSVPALARLLSAYDARILSNSLLQYCESGRSKASSHSPKNTALRDAPRLERTAPTVQQFRHLLFPLRYRTGCSPVHLSQLFLPKLLRGVVDLSIGLNRATATNDHRVMRNYRAIPFPRALLLVRVPAKRTRF